MRVSLWCMNATWRPLRNRREWNLDKKIPSHVFDGSDEKEAERDISLQLLGQTWRKIALSAGWVRSSLRSSHHPLEYQVRAKVMLRLGRNSFSAG